MSRGEAALTAEESPGEAALPADKRGDGAAAVLRIIRDIEAGGTKFSGRRRQRVLDSAAGAIGASAVVLCSAGSDGGVSIACISGPLPPAPILDAAKVSMMPPKRQWRSTALVVDGTHLVAAGRLTHFVVAILGAPPEPWVEDFVAFIAGKLIAHAPAGSQENAMAASVPARMEIPRGMVVGTSEAMSRLMRDVAATIASGMDVLLLGETGTGKELFARMIHASGPQRGGRFIAVNCAAIPSELLEAELFGIQARVATGVDARLGLFVQADGGTILLDEISELPERLQAKLLRVLQEREVLPIGASTPRKIDVRVISASNRDLEALVREGRFRADLYYRVRGLQFHIPPLRDRKEDIPALVFEFIARAGADYGKFAGGVSRTALDLLIEHDWPGNVRELESEMRRAVLVCAAGEILQPEHLGTVRWHVEQQRACADRDGVTSPERPSRNAPAETVGRPVPRMLKAVLDQTERLEIERAMATAGGNHSRAARILGVSRNGLALKLKRIAAMGQVPK